MSDTLKALLAEVNALSPGKRRAILAELSPAERTTMTPLLADAAKAAVAEAPTPAQEPPGSLDALSPTMRERVEAALAPRSNMTGVARAALGDVLAKVSEARPGGHGRSSAGATPSLLTGIGRAFGLKRQAS